MHHCTNFTTSAISLTFAAQATHPPLLDAYTSLSSRVSFARELPADSGSAAIIVVGCCR